jgi:hypothetical protein
MALQHPRANQNLVTVDERCLDANHNAVERKIDEVNILFDSLISCQKGCHSAHELRVQQRSYSLGQFQCAVKACVDDRLSPLTANFDLDRGNTILGDHARNQR